MTEPDEALLWAREHWATICDEDGFSDEAEAYRRGLCDKTLATDALFYRAGAVASEARIKVLEDEVRELKETLTATVMQATARQIPITNEIKFSAPIRALLKEADQ